MLREKNMTTTNDNQIAQVYQQEQVQQILALAMARREERGDMTREQLLEIAAELGISSNDLQSAELEWQINQGNLQEKALFNLERRGKLQRSFGRYSIVNFFLMLLNFVGSHTLSWSLPILLFWGLFMALKAWDTWQTEGENYEKALQRWRLKKQLGQSLTNWAEKLLK
jgi:hypothetical protein